MLYCKLFPNDISAKHVKCNDTGESKEVTFLNIPFLFKISSGKDSNS